MSNLQGRWSGWNIFRTMLTVGGVTVVVRVFSTAKELLIARRFGVSDELDAFMIAFMLPLFAIAVIGGSVNSALIPTYVRVREHSGEESAARLLGNVTIASLLMLLLVSLVVPFVMPLLLSFLASNFSDQKLALTRSLFPLLLPLIVVSGLSTIWTAVLNARDQFAVPAIVPSITPLLVTSGLLLMGTGFTIRSLSRATFAGYFLELIVVGLALRLTRVSLLPRWSGFDSDTRQVIFQFFPMLGGALAMGSSPVIDQSMAARLGSVSALNYGNKLVTFIESIVATAIATAALPTFSKLVALADFREIRKILRTYTVLIFAVTVPVTILLFVFSEPIVRILFERGAFTRNDSIAVSGIQRGFLGQIPFYLLLMLGLRLLSALGKNQVIMFIAIWSVVLNIVLNIILSRYFGLPGIALSTSLVFVSSCCLVLLALRRTLAQKETGST